MKKILINTIFMLCFNLIIKAQVPPSYFNTTHGLLGFQNNSYNISKFKSNYFSISLGSYPNIEPTITLTKYDTLFTIINQKTLGFSNKAVAMWKGNNLGFNQLDSSIYISGVINQDFFGVTKLNGMLWKIDKNLDTLWHKSYSNLNDSTISFNGLFVDNNGIILYGMSTESDLSGDCFIMKVDFNGNELWRKTVPLANQFGNIIKLFKTKDNCFVTVENLFDYPSAWFSDIKITKYDSTFNTIKWQRILNTPYQDLLGDLIELSDSNYVLSQGYCVSQFNAPIGTPYNRQCLTKINKNNGTTIWQKKYGKIRADIGLYIIRETPSKKIIALGIMGTAYVDKPSGTYVGTMLVTNQFGDSLNYQETFSDSMSQFNYLYDLVPANNGYYCVGSTRLPVFTGTLLTSYETQDWLVKADTNGCFNPYCLLGTGLQENQIFEQAYMIYPNPAHSLVNINAPMPIDRFDNEHFFNLFDAQGKLVLKQQITTQHFTIDISNFDKGFYIITFTDGNIVLHSRKLIIN